jgi:hypothetical protein
VRSLPLTLVARLLPVAVLAAVGIAMTTTSDSDAHAKPSAASPHPSSSGSGRPVPHLARPPADPCATVSASTVKDLVPGANPTGSKLDVSDPDRRAGCSWHALHGYDYRWLDVAYDVAPVAGQSPSAGASTVSGLGDRATISEQLTTQDGNQTREAVVVVHVGGAEITVTYNGSNFESHKAPADDTIQSGAITAAKSAIAGLGSGA